MIYLIQVPETFSHEEIANIRNDKSLARKSNYDVIVSTYKGDEIKHSVLGDSFTEELHNAKKCVDAAWSIIFKDSSFKRTCSIKGGNTMIYERYGFSEETVENAILDCLIQFLSLESENVELKKNIAELEHKVKMLSL